MTGLPEQVAEALARGVEVITANQRSARVLRLAYDESMRAAEHRLWQPANVLAIESWMAGMWHRLLVLGGADRMLLNRTQEQRVWRTVIVEDNAALMSPDALAGLAMGAWARLCLYNGVPRLSQGRASPDTRAFGQWARAFEQRCKEGRWLSPARLPQALSARAERGRLPLGEAGLLLVGFNTMPPAYEALFAAIQSAGFPVHREISAKVSGERLLFAATDELAEMRAAAAWARRILERDAAARVGLVVPGLEGKKQALGRVFRDVLDGVAIAQEPPYEFSLGEPLAGTSLAAAASNLLRWQHQALPLEMVSALLLSPYFGASLGTNESRAAAEFDAFELRQTKMLRPEVTLDEMIALVERSRRQAALADLLARLRAMRHARLEQAMAGDGQRSHAEWADGFRAVLEAARWTRRAGESSLGFQTLERWESALDELATLDFDGSRTTAAEALRALERIGAETTFAPESRNAPVQVMGPLEAAGLRFDALWVLGVGDLSWPPRQATTPLLAWQLQRSLGMPGADAAQARELAATMTARLAASGPGVVFSYAEMTAEGPQRPSSVLDALHLREVEMAAPLPEKAVLPMKRVADDLALPQFPDRVARGGAQVLQLQAECGFRAFAERRLSSTAPQTRQPGLDARERGSAVHAVMEAFWDEVPGQQELREMPLAARHDLLDRCIKDAVATNEKRGGSNWDAAYLDTQRKRLRSLLRPWLDQELLRPEFAVAQREASREASIGPLRLRVKFDRVDQTEGGELILDYKTGDASPNDWLSGRPDAPQLPLYAVLSSPEPLGGVAFAVLRAGDDLCLKGFATGPEVLHKPANLLPMEAQVDEWRRILTGLAEDFAGGDARVDPKRGTQTCKYCAQRLLCRLDPISLRDEDEETSDA